MALLDAVSEEINNTIFRLGHAKLGLSAALIGSGMAFRYDLFRDTMLNIKAVGGFDRELELTLLYQGKRFHYLPETFVFDEKYRIRRTSPVSVVAGFRHSGIIARRLSGIWGRLSLPVTGILRQAVPAVFHSPFALDGIYVSPCRVVHMLSLGMGNKWWLLLVLLVAALSVAVPKRYCTARLATALLSLPYTFLLMAANIFKLRGANKNFIHTRHGVKE